MHFIFHHRLLTGSLRLFWPICCWGGIFCFGSFGGQKDLMSSNGLIRSGLYMLRVLLTCAIVCQMTVKIRAENYSVKGSFNYQGQPPDGTRIKPFLGHFDLTVDDCRWKMTIGLDEPTNANTFIYQYDGTNLTYLTHYGGILVSNSPRVSARVEASPVPHTWQFGELPWLAFASACYFCTITNSRALSLHTTASRKGRVNRYDVPIELEISSSPPHLPSLVRYITDKSLTVSEDEVTISTKPLSSPFNTGYVSEQFKSDEFTNINGLSFPMIFEYREFVPKANAKTTNDLHCLIVVLGKASEITMGGQIVDTKFPENRAVIGDLRVQQRGVLYFVTNGLVPSTNSPEVTIASARAAMRLKRAEEIQQERESHTSRKRIAWFLFLITTFTLPAIFFIFRGRKPKAG